MGVIFLLNFLAKKSFCCTFRSRHLQNRLITHRIKQQLLLVYIYGNILKDDVMAYSLFTLLHIQPCITICWR